MKRLHYKIGFFIILSIFGYTTSLVLSSLANVSASPHPTSVPWINNKSLCEHTGRTWRNDDCWDAEHNPLF